MSVNKVILIGHLGKDPEVSVVGDGIKVAKFSLATSESYVKDGKKIEQTEWHNIVAWRGLAEVCENYLQKGKQIYLEGKIRTRSYEDKEGVKKYATDIVADSIQMLGKKSDDAGSNKSDPEPTSFKATEFEASQVNDDLPF